MTDLGHETPIAMRDNIVLDFARSELFDRTFDEGMDLVEVTAAYLDGAGRQDAKHLSRAAAMAYAAESMRLTTRLMQVASWLLVQRAVKEGNMAPTDASQDRYRLKEGPEQDANGVEYQELPAALKDLTDRALRLYDRILHLDRRMYVDQSSVQTANAVQSHLEKLQAAFGG